MSESKTSKKNAKRAAARTKKRLLEGLEKSKSDGHEGAAAAVASHVIPKPRSRKEELRQQMEEAKQKKDFALAQQVREQLWLLSDQAAGTVGEGAEFALEREAQARQAATSAVPCGSSGEPLQEASGKTVGSTLSEPEKRLRALNRKLRQIEAIKENKAAGKKLEDGQITKLQSEGEVLAEIHEIEEALSKLP